jgi:hypothetical protein
VRHDNDHYNPLLPAALFEDGPAGFVEHRSAALNEDDHLLWRWAARWARRGH